MSFIPKPQEIYKHFKGNLYQITAIAQHTETGELLVVYQALYGAFQTYARPLEMFISRVDKEKYPDVSQEFRFELQGPEASRQRELSGGEVRSPQDSAKQIPPLPREDSFPEQGAAESSGTEGDKAESSGTEGHAAQGSETERGQVEAEAEEALECALDTQVLEFLDADGYEEKLNILTGLHHRITDEMLTTMAIACDVEIQAGDLEERYQALKTCLATRRRYECSRIR